VEGEDQIVIAAETVTESSLTPDSSVYQTKHIVDINFLISFSCCYLFIRLTCHL
jgi:hypothetical protein